MTLKEIVDGLGLKVAAGEAQLSRKVSGGYCGDLLSCVMARAAQGDIWVTVQAHPNVVAVAVLVGVSGVIVTEGGRLDAAMLARAEEEGIPILSSQRTSFDVVAGLVELGLKGSRS